MIAVIGDSHSGSFNPKGYPPGPARDCLSRFRFFYVGPRTAHQLSEHLNTVERGVALRYALEQSAALPILTIFGEIDIRYHIHRQALQQHRPERALVEETALRYLDFVKELRDQKNYDIHVLSVTPAALPEQNSDSLDVPYPNFQERVAATAMLNEEFRFDCRARKIPFVDIFHLLADDSGKMLPELNHDGIHLRYTPEIFAEIERQVNRAE